MRKVLFTLFLFLGVQLFSQEINIDFEDSSLSGWEESTPGRWHIDADLPINGIGSLHHNYDSDVASTDMISYKHTQLHLDSALTTWKFSVRYNYTPAAGNNWAFCLTSSMAADEITPSGNTQGYIVGVNYTGSDDIIKLWRQGNGEASVIINSDFNWQENDLMGKQVDFNVIRSIKGEWTMQIDTADSGYFNIGVGIDSIYSKSEYIGVYYAYSITQDRKLWIDDITINGFFREDKESPIISSYNIQEQNEILLQFNEEVDTTAGALFVLNRKYNPVDINWINTSSLVLSFDRVFENENLLEIYGLTDLKSNISQIESLSFSYYSPQKFDVIMSEIMADPTPRIELPECEYIELYNRSEKTLNMGGWRLYSGTRAPIVFGDFDFKPRTRILIVEEDYEDQFPDSINIISFSSLPSLPNSGETLMLLNKYEEEIHKIGYSDDWYSDASKEGGYSLEMVDSEYPCVTTNNWRSSVFEEGGTPGFRNSVDGILEDYPTSVLIRLRDITREECTLVFTESLDSSLASNTSYFALDNTEISISSSTPISPWFKELVISFSEPLVEGEIYTLRLGDLLDCSGMKVLSEPIRFGLPQFPDSSDIVINEVLFDEIENEVPEFIELYNKSDKVIDLQGMKVANIDMFADTIKARAEIITSNYQVFPKDYIVLTENRALLTRTFSELQSSKVIEVKQWFNLLNDGGKIGMLEANDSIIDKAVYASEMHFALLDNKKGVSLERISVLESGVNPKNWHSAATEVGYATPGAENSQSFMPESSVAMVSINPKEFSPDNDGQADFLTINYNFPQNGYAASVKIYTQRGLLVNQLVNNELCALTGSFVWDGLDDNSDRLGMGYYIIYFEAWHPNGNVIKEKMVCLLLPETK